MIITRAWFASWVFYGRTPNSTRTTAATWSAGRTTKNGGKLDVVSILYFSVNLDFKAPQTKKGPNFLPPAILYTWTTKLVKWMRWSSSLLLSLFLSYCLLQLYAPMVHYILEFLYILVKEAVHIMYKAVVTTTELGVINDFRDHLFQIRMSKHWLY